MKKQFYQIKLFHKEINYILDLLRKNSDIHSDIIYRNIKSQINDKK